MFRVVTCLFIDGCARLLVRRLTLLFVRGSTLTLTLLWMRKKTIISIAIELIWMLLYLSPLLTITPSRCQRSFHPALFLTPAVVIRLLLLLLLLSWWSVTGLRTLGRRKRSSEWDRWWGRAVSGHLSRGRCVDVARGQCGGHHGHVAGLCGLGAVVLERGRRMTDRIFGPYGRNGSVERVDRRSVLRWVRFRFRFRFGFCLGASLQ